MNEYKSNSTNKIGQLNISTVSEFICDELVNEIDKIREVKIEFTMVSGNTYKLKLEDCSETSAKDSAESSKDVGQSNEETPSISAQNSACKELTEETGKPSCSTIESGKQKEPTHANDNKMKSGKERSKSEERICQGFLSLVNVKVNQNDPSELIINKTQDSKHLSLSDNILLEGILNKAFDFGIDPNCESLTSFNSDMHLFSTHAYYIVGALNLLKSCYKNEIEPKINPIDMIEPVDFVNFVIEQKSNHTPKSFKHALFIAELALTFFNKDVKEAEELLKKIRESD